MHMLRSEWRGKLRQGRCCAHVIGRALMVRFAEARGEEKRDLPNRTPVFLTGHGVVPQRDCKMTS